MDEDLLPDLSDLCLAPHASVREAIALIDRNRKGIVLLVDEQRRLVGTVTDGDVRRAMLAGQSLDADVGELLPRKASTQYAKPAAARADTDRIELLRIMREREVRQLPLLDDEERVVGLVTLDELMPQEVLPLQAVVMAGGLGTRLRPLTDELPKPMLPVGGRPVMELMIEQLRHAGIRRVHITTHYKPSKIVDYFGDGRSFGVELAYVNEDRPLGTAGALSLLSSPQEPLLVINGDIVAQVDFRAMLRYHQEHRADMTVAVRRYDLQVPYGVVESEGSHVKRISEKPLLSFFVNAGLYLLEPTVHCYLDDGQRLDMTELVQRLLREGRSVVSFPIREYWIDIGQHADYEQAQEDVRTGRLLL